MTLKILDKMKNLFALAIIIILVSCKQEYVQTPSTSMNMKKAKVVELAPSTDPLPIFVAGRVQSLENMKLSFKTSGIVQHLNVNEGEFVRKGQVIGQLDLSEINAQVDQAVANVEKLKRDFLRFQKLYDDSAATLQSLQDIETGLKIAESVLAIAKFNQEHSSIVAPASGRILKKLVEVNELVNPGQPIYFLGAKSTGMSLKVGMADRDVVKLSLGDKAKVTFDAYPEAEGHAEITEIAADGHPITGTFAVEMTIIDFPYDLKSGFFAKAAIFPGNQDPYFKIPIQAMVEGLQDQVAILVPEKNKAKRLVVTPQYIGDEFFTVELTDLQNSSHGIITEGAAYLREGESFETLE